MRPNCSAVAEENVDLAEEHEARAVERAASVEAVAAAETITITMRGLAPSTTMMPKTQILLSHVRPS
eukprot:2953413-Rhodomonas_salina.1